MLLQNGKEDGIRKHLLEFYGLKQVDGKVPLPQVVLNEYKTVKKAPVNVQNSQADSESGTSELEESKYYTKKGDSNRKGKKPVSTNERKSIQLSKGSHTGSRRSSFDIREGTKYQNAIVHWIGDYNSCQYLMD